MEARTRAPTDIVKGTYTLPFDLYPKQVETINELAPNWNAGVWLDMGTGKTICFINIALYHKLVSGSRAIVIMPPLLVPQWAAAIRSLKPAPSVVRYEGTPKQRAALDLNADFLLVGVQIFKRDFHHIWKHFKDVPYVVGVDEAQMIANPCSANHEHVMDFSVGHAQYLMTGTPANKPGDVYGLLKFTAPGTYRSQRHFENMHVADRDFFGNPSEWQNLAQLHANVLINSKRVLREDMFAGIVEPLYIHEPYALEPAHYKLYKQLAEEQLLLLEDGGKVDATSAGRLMHALGQIICNYDNFSGDPGDVSASIELVRDKLDQMGGDKLVVFANYKMTVRGLLKALGGYGAVAINSEVTQAKKQENLTRFKEDPSCRVIVIQFISGGAGLDGLQHVCNQCLFIEPCQQPRDFHQAVARLHRAGQKDRVLVHLPMAEGTLQNRAFKNLISNDTVVNQVVRNAVDLKDAIFGK